MRRKNDSDYSDDGISKAFNFQTFLLIMIVTFLIVLKFYSPEQFVDVSSNIDNLINKEAVIDVGKALDDISIRYAKLIGSDEGGKGGMFPVDENINTTEALKAPKGASLSPVMVTSKLLLPIENGYVSSPYGYRLHPITNQLDFHTGTDIAASLGTPILASLYGKVAEIGESQIFGNYIVLQHSANFKTVYCHCDSIIAPLGAFVKQGERIATVGSTGISTGPHLHLEVIVDGQYADPAWVYKELQSEI